MDRTASARLGKRWRHIMARDVPERAAFMQIEVAELGLANAHCISQHGLEHRLKLARRTRDDAQHLRARRLLLQSLGELTGARFGLLFQLDQRIGLAANVRSRLRSVRTRLAVACWALCAFERQGHLVGTVTGPLPVGPSQGSSLSILTEPHDEFPALHSITSSVRASSVSGTVRPSALAVLVLITSSYFVGACTGRSPGFSPLRMRPT